MFYIWYHRRSTAGPESGTRVDQRRSSASPESGTRVDHRWSIAGPINGHLNQAAGKEAVRRLVNDIFPTIQIFQTTVIGGFGADL